MLEFLTLSFCNHVLFHRMSLRIVIIRIVLLCAVVICLMLYYFMPVVLLF